MPTSNILQRNASDQDVTELSLPHLKIEGSIAEENIEDLEIEQNQLDASPTSILSSYTQHSSSSNERGHISSHSKNDTPTNFRASILSKTSESHSATGSVSGMRKRPMTPKKKYSVTFGINTVDENSAGIMNCSSEEETFCQQNIILANKNASDSTDNRSNSNSSFQALKKNTSSFNLRNNLRTSNRPNSSQNLGLLTAQRSGSNAMIISNSLSPNAKNRETPKNLPNSGLMTPPRSGTNGVNSSRSSFLRSSLRKNSTGSLRSWMGLHVKKEDSKSVSSLQLQPLPTPLAGKSSPRHESFTLMDSKGFENEERRRISSRNLGNSKNFNDYSGSANSWTFAQALRRSLDGFMGWNSEHNSNNSKSANAHEKNILYSELQDKHISSASAITESSQDALLVPTVTVQKASPGLQFNNTVVYLIVTNLHHIEFVEQESGGDSTTKSSKLLDENYHNDEFFSPDSAKKFKGSQKNINPSLLNLNSNDPGSPDSKSDDLTKSTHASSRDMDFSNSAAKSRLQKFVADDNAELEDGMEKTNTLLVGSPRRKLVHKKNTVLVIDELPDNLNKSSQNTKKKNNLSLNLEDLESYTDESDLESSHNLLESTNSGFSSEEEDSPRSKLNRLLSFFGKNFARTPNSKKKFDDFKNDIANSSAVKARKSSLHRRRKAVADEARRKQIKKWIIFSVIIGVILLITTLLCVFLIACKGESDEEIKEDMLKEEILAKVLAKKQQALEQTKSIQTQTEDPDLAGGASGDLTSGGVIVAKNNSNDVVEKDPEKKTCCDDFYESTSFWVIGSLTCCCVGCSALWIPFCAMGKKTPGADQGCCARCCISVYGCCCGEDDISGSINYGDGSLEVE